MAHGPKSKKRRAKLVRTANKLAQSLPLCDFRGAEDFMLWLSDMLSQHRETLEKLSPTKKLIYIAAVEAGYKLTKPYRVDKSRMIRSKRAIG